MWRSVLGFPASIALLSGCTEAPKGVDACVSPKLLRVKVGEMLFDLPNTVQMPHALTMDLDRKPEKLGIVSLDYTGHRSEPANRMECNDKAHPIADFGEDLGLTYVGDGTDPTEYRLGDRMYALVDLGSYDPKLRGSWRSQYLADVGDIKNVRFVERIDVPPTPGSTMGQAIYKFAYRGRTLAMTCQVWDDSKTDGKKNNLRPAYPNQCVPKISFRVGSVVIGVDQQSYASGPGGKVRLIPPEDWPKQWAYTINKILRFRVQ